MKQRLVKCDQVTELSVGMSVILAQCVHRGHKLYNGTWWHAPDAQQDPDRYTPYQCPQQRLHGGLPFYRPCGLCGYDGFTSNEVAFRAETVYGNMVRPPGVVIYDAV